MRPVPIKRTSANTGRPDSLPGHSPSPSDRLPPRSQVKRERSPSPLLIEKRLVTSGTKRFAPVPNNCLPSCKEYKQNRLKWMASCAEELEMLKLIPERKLIRDDGLIIDWRSHVPVWSDTLKPDPQPDLAATIMLAHKSNAQWRRSPVHAESPSKPRTIFFEERCTSTSSNGFGNIRDTESPPKKKLPVPPRPSLVSKRRNNHSEPTPVVSSPSGPSSSSPLAKTPRLPNETYHNIASHSPSGDHISSLSAARAHLSSDMARQGQVDPPDFVGRDQSIISGLSAAGEQQMSEMTLDYLRRYVQTYEGDRASLASAYARNASFAYRVHQVVQKTSESTSSTRTVSSESFSSGTKRTRLEIVTTLLTLPCLHSDGQHSDMAQMEYDIFYLGANLGMFVRKEVDPEDAASEGVWPVTAIAHQVLVFQT